MCMHNKTKNINANGKRIEKQNIKKKCSKNSTKSDVNVTCHKGGTICNAK